MIKTVISFDETKHTNAAAEKVVHSPKVLALSGGVGGAKLALGLANVLDAEDLVVMANTADDFEHYGLNISPDLDTLLYTLAGISDQERGWGLADESWRAMEALTALGGETWFRLGDGDLATHLERTQRLSHGETLTEVTQSLCKRLGVKHRIVPMSDDRVRTIVEVKGMPADHCGSRLLGFQEYFVREQCRPEIQSVRFEGLDRATTQPEVLRLLNDGSLDAVILCPSNPFVSIDPILQLPELRRALRQTRTPVVAVSPIIDGEAVKGPTAKMMRELGIPVSATAIARHYADFLDGFVLHETDERLGDEIEQLGVAVCCTNTLMHTLQDRVALASDVVLFSQALANFVAPTKLASS